MDDSISMLTGVIAKTLMRDPTNRRTTGITIKPPTCCAARTSLILDETNTFASMEVIPIAGAKKNMAIAHERLGSKSWPTTGNNIRSIAMMFMAKATYVPAIVGRNAARIFPNSNSLSVVGVARRGSKLRLTFSPTKLCDATMVGTIAGTKDSMNSIMPISRGKICSTSPSREGSEKGTAKRITGPSNEKIIGIPISVQKT